MDVKSHMQQPNLNIVWLLMEINCPQTNVLQVRLAKAMVCMLVLVCRYQNMAAKQLPIYNTVKN